MYSHASYLYFLHSEAFKQKSVSNKELCHEKWPPFEHAMKFSNENRCCLRELLDYTANSYPYLNSLLCSRRKVAFLQAH